MATDTPHGEELPTAAGESKIVVGDEDVTVRFSWAAETYGPGRFLIANVIRQVPWKVNGNASEFDTETHLEVEGLESMELEESNYSVSTNGRGEGRLYVPFVFRVLNPVPAQISVTVKVKGAGREFNQALSPPVITDNTSGAPASNPTPKRLHFSDNPMNGRTTIFCAPPAAGRCCLRAYDVAGRVVRTIAEGELTSGEHSFTWDGTYDSGKRVPSGLYFLRFEGPGFIEKARLVVL